MTSTQRVWLTRQAHDRLQSELGELRKRRNAEVPDDTMDAYEYGGFLRCAVQARIRQIQDLLANTVVGQDPADDGIAEPGMVLIVRYDDTGETETLLLGVRGAEDADIDVSSMQAPLGRAIAGARPGEQRTYSIPSGKDLPVTLVRAVPYGLCAPKSARPQTVPSRRNCDPGRLATRPADRPANQARSDSLASPPAPLPNGLGAMNRNVRSQAGPSAHALRG